ncbi:ATPase family AAA domain-containing protein 2B [Liparis tanakae]|uniref:ATPase family AAA domain-containing protein 2B n=1 Tax=Liparis tanakae TaxID=230148 RepID=A0A4Z2FKW5_9TELE|nr:ATPase family AAA domain-containing protein 2B [Liparis tanakae]
MVNTRKSSRPRTGPFISSRTRSSSRTERNSEEHKEPSSDVSSPGSPRLPPPSKRTRRQAASEPSSSDTSPSPQAKGQRVSWEIPTYRTRLSSRIMQNGHAHLSHRSEPSGGGEHSHMNGHVELKRSCRGKKSKFEHLNQSLLFDQLVNRRSGNPTFGGGPGRRRPSRAFQRVPRLCFYGVGSSAAVSS